MTIARDEIVQVATVYADSGEVTVNVRGDGSIDIDTPLEIIQIPPSASAAVALAVGTALGWQIHRPR